MPAYAHICTWMCRTEVSIIQQVPFIHFLERFTIFDRGYLCGCVPVNTGTKESRRGGDGLPQPEVIAFFEPFYMCVGN